MRRHFTLSFSSAIAAVVVVYVAFAATTPGFASENTAYVVLGQFAIFGVAALGFGVTMIAGEFDLALPYTAALCGIVAMKTATDAGMVLGLLAGVTLGLAIGLAQGVLIYLLRITSLVFTLGTGFAISGIAYMVSETTVVTPDIGFGQDLQSRLWVFSPASLIALGIFLVVGLALAYWKVGREILAIGGGRPEAQAAGIGLRRPLITAFAISGTLAGVTGGLVAAQTGGANPTSFNTLLLNAVTAAFIGGVSLRGGRGNPAGIALGVITIGLLNTGFSLRGEPYYITTLATASLLLLLIVIELIAPRVAAVRRRSAAAVTT
jgi:simple sugar transport system permease protein/ribose transport system permease protein